MADEYLSPRGPTPPVVPFLGVNAGLPVIPKLYWDAYDDEQRIKVLWKCFAQFVDLYNEMVPQVNANSQDNSELQETLEEIKNGEYVDGYIDQLASWIDNNLQQLVARIALYVFPGFYWDGECWRYAISVPESWNFLKFTWTWSQDDYTYHLSLSWVGSEVDASEIDNLRNRVSTLEGLIGDFLADNDLSLQRSVNRIIGYEPLE